MKSWDIATDARFGASEPCRVILLATDVAEVAWVALKRGQRFAWERPETALVQVWSGRVAVHADGTTTNVSTGQSLAFSGGGRATITGLSEAVVQTVALRSRLPETEYSR